MPNYPHPATVVFGVTATATEQLRPPDESGGWQLLDWKPFPIPGNAPGQVGIINTAIWAKPKPGVRLCGLCLNELRNAEELPGDNDVLNLAAAEQLPRDQASPPCDKCNALVTIRYFVPKLPRSVIDA